MKKNLLLKVWTALCCILLSSNIYGQDIDTVANNFHYTLHEDGTATFVGVKSENPKELELGEVIIPGTVSHKGREYKVTVIDSLAFSRCEKLTSVTIPEGVIKLSWGAFGNCIALTDITIPTSVKIIEMNVFYDTNWYKNLPDGLVYINSVLHSYKGKMPNDTTLIVKEGTVSIAGAAFLKCTKLTSISLPPSLKRIDMMGFAGCNKLSKIILPKNLEYIDKVVFNGTSIDTLTIPASVKHIGSSNSGAKVIRYESTLPPTTDKRNRPDSEIEYYVPFQSFATYYKAGFIHLGTTANHSIKALEDGAKIYAVTSHIENNGMGGKVIINGEESLAGVKEGDEIKINVVADEGYLIHKIEINGAEPIWLENYTTFSYTVPCPLETYTINVSFVNPESISTQTTNNIRVYASKGILKIENANEMVPFTVFNLTGQPIYQGTTNNNEEVSLSAGIYLVKVGTETHKVVIE